VSASSSRRGSLADLNVQPVTESVGLAVQQALDAMSDIYVVYDRQWRFVYQNKAQRDAMIRAGLDPQEAMGKVLWDVMPFLAGTAGEASSRKAMDERVETEWEETYPPDIRLHGRAFPTPDGGIAVVARNVSEQWKAELRHQAAAERTAALQRTTAAIANAMTIHDLADTIVSEGLMCAGGMAGSVAVVADNVIKLIATAGYAAGQIERFLEFPLDAALPIAEAIRAKRAVVLKSARARDEEYPELAGIRRVNGDGALAAIPMIVDDQAIGALGFNFPENRILDSEDIEFLTALAQQCAQGLERARLYEAEKEAHARAEKLRIEAEAANKAKTDFLTMMSHELRTPLNAIGGYADLIKAGIRGPVTDEQMLDLHRLKRNQRHLLSLINDVLNFAKLQAGTVQVTHAEFDIAATVMEVEELITPQLLEKELSYELVMSATDCWCIGDPEKTQQILLNLLSNAIKFTAREGRVMVSVDVSDSHVLVHVADTGFGIPPEELEAVFEPFVQLNRTNTTHNEGTGLGLSISRDLARAMGGELSVSSDFGVGSVFTLTLPRGPAAMG
jgi:signal transduction histidine kinase